MIYTVGKLRIALAAAGTFATLRGIAYYPLANLPDELPVGLTMIDDFISINGWGTIWLFSGILIICSAIFRKNSMAAWGTFVGLMTVWGFAYLYGYFYCLMHGDYNRDWITASTYLLCAFIIGVLSKYAGDIGQNLKQVGDELNGRSVE